MASPIQIVLNHENFEEARDKAPGGSKTDFFAHKDREFTEHKRDILAQLNSISEKLTKSGAGETGYIKVALRKKAIAKSHRPLVAIFKEDRIPLVGGDDLGELIFEANPVSISKVSEAVHKAETVTRMKYDKAKGKEVPNPSSFKSELGAIDRISIYGAPEKRDFTVEEAVSWLANPMTGSSYHVDLFEIPSPRSSWDAVPDSKRLLFKSFIDGLLSMDVGLDVSKLPSSKADPSQLAFRLEKSDRRPVIRLGSTRARVERDRARDLAPFDAEMEHHRRLLEFLDWHPLVRRIELPPIVAKTHSKASATSVSSQAQTARIDGITSLPELDQDASFPTMGIIDGGVSEFLDPWIIDRWDFLAEEDADLDHGTFIGGLTVVGNMVNGGEICIERDGVAIVDIGVLPDENKIGAFETYYSNGITDFFDEISQAVAEINATNGVLIFNMSLNIQRPAIPSRYDRFASTLDRIAEENDALFVLSAGNTAPHSIRAEWSTDSTQAIIDLGLARDDALLMPAESVRNIAVAALNPPGLDPIVPFAPANYSCRGPGVRAGVKPDLAQVGGAGTQHHSYGHGLASLKPDGTIVDGCGTSYAAPLVAKTAAILDHSIEGDVSRETLMALLLHHAQIPEVLQAKPLRPLARDLIGFGMSSSADSILQGDDHQITLVFASRIRGDQQIEFGFSWPPSLVTADGKCRGKAKLTLVSSPPLDARFGSEFVRVNVNAALQQEEPNADGSTGWKGRLNPIYLPDKGDRHRFEQERIDHDLKWSPVKGYERVMPKGVGKSSNWRLFVDYLTRAREELPQDGVPFTAVLTISDPKKTAYVFDEMRQSLQSTGVVISDIRTAARITSRV